MTDSRSRTEKTVTWMKRICAIFLVFALLIWGVDYTQTKYRWMPGIAGDIWTVVKKSIVPKGKPKGGSETAQLRGNVASNGELLVKTGTSLASIKDRASANSGEIQALRSDIRTLESTINRLENRPSSGSGLTKADASALTKDVQELKIRVATLERRPDPEPATPAPSPTTASVAAPELGPELVEDATCTSERQTFDGSVHFKCVADSVERWCKITGDGPLCRR